MFKAIVECNHSQLRELGTKFVDAQGYSDAAALSLDFAFQKPMKIQAAAPGVVFATLQGFNAYVREIQKLLSEPNPCQIPSIQKLFGFSPIIDSENLFIVPKRSFLHAFISQQRRTTMPSTLDSEGYALSAEELTAYLHGALRERLKRKVQDENLECTKAPALHVCPAFAAFRVCNATRHCGGSHNIEAAKPEAFHLRVRMLLQQILIVQSTSSLEAHLTVARQRR